MQNLSRPLPNIVPEDVSEDEIFYANLPAQSNITQENVAYVRSLKLYTTTLLPLDKIASYCLTSPPQIQHWIEKDNWNELRQIFCGNFTPNKVEELQKNTVEAALTFSTDISEQVGVVSDALLREAYKVLTELSNRDVVNFALKFKELEAKVKGLMTGNQSSNNVSVTTIYQNIADKGAEQYYGEAGKNAQEITIEVVPESVSQAFPDHTIDKPA